MTDGPPIGVLFAIQRFSVHDGPGIRTTVFLKGCPLRCRWCQNPEGLTREIGVWHFANLCSGCGRCVSACRAGALSLAVDGSVAVDGSGCARCGECVDACNRNALAFDGFAMDADALAEDLLADQVFFENSGGGVTFSGGEPYEQAEFFIATAARLRKRGVGTAVETSLSAAWDRIERSLDSVDDFLVDLKTVDPGRHRQATGIDNAIILDNYRRLATRLEGTNRLLIRTPLVPGYTADRENIRDIGRFIKSVSPSARWELMNFNPLAAAKYRRLHLPSSVFAEGAREYSIEEMRRFRNWAAEEGIAVI